MDKIEQYIINACVANDPDIISKKKNHCPDCYGYCQFGNQRGIFLHDVLGAIQKEGLDLKISILSSQENYIKLFFEDNGDEFEEEWNLKNPLHEQTEKTKLLLAQILGFKL